MSTAARTYNQSHVARPRNEKRRVSIYWTWSYPWEAQRDPAAMENRFSTITEVRNVTWPAYERPEYEAANFLQGIAGTLELFHRSTLDFQGLVGELTGHPVAVFQRVDQAGYHLPIGTDPGRHRHADGVRPRPPDRGVDGRSRGGRGDNPLVAA